MADLRGLGLSFLARAMNLIRTLLQESLTPMNCGNIGFVSSLLHG